jgi:hypothetical protein
MNVKWEKKVFFYEILIRDGSRNKKRPIQGITRFIDGEVSEAHLSSFTMMMDDKKLQFICSRFMLNALYYPDTLPTRSNAKAHSKLAFLSFFLL